MTLPAERYYTLNLKRLHQLRCREASAPHDKDLMITPPAERYYTFYLKR